MTKNYLVQAVISSLKELYAKDEVLVKRGLCERCLVHRLAVYLERIFEGFNVDCEFNKSFYKDVVSNKALSSVSGNYVDILVHKRSNKLGENLLCIEAKKEENKRDRDKDRRNLEILTEEDRFAYTLGFYVILGKTYERTRIEVYEKGSVVNKI